MKRDMDLIRKILFKIEEQYQPGQQLISDLKIDGYDLPTVAEHCDLLNQSGLVKEYRVTISHVGIHGFRIGNLTSQGYDYLELIRNDDVWEKAKSEIDTKQRPNTIEEISRIAGVFFGNIIKEMTG